MIKLFRKAAKLPTIFLHIGMNKTGTTSIQSFLSSHRAQLKEAGILYPKAGEMGGAHYKLSTAMGFSHGAAAPSLELQQLKKAFLAELKSRNYHAVIFSSEDWVLDKSLEPVRDFFDGFTVKVIVYLRRHDHWWLSAYAQAVKMKRFPPWGLGPQAFIQFHRKRFPSYGNYRWLIDRWAEVFGEDNMLVRPYESLQNQPGLEADFLKLIDNGEDLLNFAENRIERLNQSPSIKKIMLMSVVQKAVIDDVYYTALMKYVKNMDDGGSTGKIDDWLPPTIRRNIISQNESDYQYIAKNYMGRETEVLFFEPMPVDDPAWKAQPWLSNVEVVEHVVAALTKSRDSGSVRHGYE